MSDKEFTTTCLAPISHGEVTRTMDAAISRLLQGIYADREAILTAFIAKYGVGPDEIEQCNESTVTGVRWYVRRKASSVDRELREVAEAVGELRTSEELKEISTYNFKGATKPDAAVLRLRDLVKGVGP